MSRKKLIWSIYPYYFVVIIGALCTVAFIATQKLNNLYLQEIAETLTVRAELVENSIKELPLEVGSSEIDSLIHILGKISDTRITVIDTNGVVIADSKKDRNTMENHKNRPEVAVAFSDSIGQEIRYSSTLHTDMMYIAIPIKKESRIFGVIRTSLPMHAIQTALNTFNRDMLFSGLLITFIVTILSLLIFRKISLPLRELQKGVKRISQGKLETRIPHFQSEELGSLSDSMNEMASQLNRRIDTIVQQRNEREAILSSLAEGVLALDMNEKVVNYNTKVLELLEISDENIIGKSVQEIVRNNELHDFIDSILHGIENEEKDLHFKLSSEKYIAVYGTILINHENKKIGTVIVLNDITKLKRLDKIRRDFVANVSHELRTPITAIKGSVETLLDGALDDSESARKFTQIINRHTSRLISIVEDLLSLAKFENESVLHTMQFETENLFNIIELSVLAVEQKSTAKNIKILLECDKELTIHAQHKYLEQAIINLLDNALKYSDNNTTITIQAVRKTDKTTISITDQGCGIPSNHLPRLFERFYRVESARSREMGGTGLGLAIVKHIARIHNGNVEVHSTPNEGSTFSIHIPH